MNEIISKHTSKAMNTQPSQDKTGKRTIFILPYIKGITNRIGRILNKYKIQTVFKPLPQKDRAKFEKF